MLGMKRLGGSDKNVVAMMRMDPTNNEELYYRRCWMVRMMRKCVANDIGGCCSELVKVTCYRRLRLMFNYSMLNALYDD